MECPFPGMDPYIERPAVWPDFHDSLITAIRGALQPVLRPKYAALVQDRLYVVEAERPIWPDLAVVKTRSSQSAPAVQGAVLDEPVIFEMSSEELREPYIEIVETAGNRLITALEVLSPDNKLPGEGRRQYLKKRKEIRASRVNLVEIDLLRAGRTTCKIPAPRLASLPPWRYMIAVTRGRKRHEIYPFALDKRLPCLAVPLTPEDADVPLDLQAAFTRCWQEGPYPELLRYDGPPPGTMTAAESVWCEERLKHAGLRRS